MNTINEKTKQLAKWVYDIRQTLGQFNFSDWQIMLKLSYDFGPLLAQYRINVILMSGRATCDVGPTLAQCRTHWANVGSMLDQCHEKTRNTLGQRWPNTLGQHWADEQNYIGPTSFANIGPM